MSDDLASFPIVVLENDYPEAIGKVGLFDYIMPVGTSGFKFVAAVPGILYSWGPLFSEKVQRAANSRAAAVLSHMGIIRGETFAFLRNGVELTQLDLATALGVPLAILEGYEDGTIPIPVNIWNYLATLVCSQDGCMPFIPVASNPDFRARTIRVFPKIPMESQQVSDGSCEEPVPLVGPNCFVPC